MPMHVSARGYTSVLLVLNMKRFVCEADQPQFERARGREDFARALRSDWLQQSEQQDLFVPLHSFEKLSACGHVPPADHMTTEDIGFATGIFRSLMLERYVFPTYWLNKAQLKFPPELESNFQFKKLFREALNRWEIYIRPSVSGFFTLRLTQKYDAAPRPFLSIAKDTLRLQESLDVPSAQRRLERNRQEYRNDPAALEEKERSIHAFLNWLGAEEKENGNVMYYPVQWKLAMVIAEQFVRQVGQEVSLLDGGAIHFVPPPPNPSIPLHDSYVIHHFDMVLAHPSLLAKKPKKPVSEGVQIPVSVQDIRQSSHLRCAFANIIEGTVLRAPAKGDAPEESDSAAHFPAPRWSLVDALTNDPSYNQASWNDELCLIAGRTAVVVPSALSHEHEMAVTTVPGATLKVKYARYWGAIERMIEFVFEVRVLAQLIDSESYRFLGEIAQTLEKSRLGLTQGNIVLDATLKEQIVQASNLRRIVAWVQNVSYPQFWSRAEYAVRKAEYLFTQLGISQTLAHVEHNMASINSMVDHVDELYVADLSEKGNDRATLLSLGLAAASLALVLLMLPSFWIDGFGLVNDLAGLPPTARANFPNGVGDPVVRSTLVVGTLIGVVLIVLATILIYKAWQRRDLVLEMFRKLFDGSRT